MEYKFSSLNLLHFAGNEIFAKIRIWLEDISLPLNTPLSKMCGITLLGVTNVLLADRVYLCTVQNMFIFIILISLNAGKNCNGLFQIVH
jgi:hypothetical protein